MGLVEWLKSQVLCHVLIGYVFLASGLLVNLLQLCTVPVWWLNKSLARRVNCRLGYCISSPSLIFRWMIGQTEIGSSSTYGNKVNNNS